VLNKNKFLAIALTLLLAIPMLLATIPATSAQYTAMPDRATQTEVAASPHVIGITQQVLINIMTYPGPSGPTYEAQNMVGGLTGGFSNISVTITAPDGTKETFMPIDMTLAQCGISIPGQAQIVGHLEFYYQPKQTGNYSVTASFPGKTYTTDNISPTLKLSVFYKGSQSTQSATFTVQQDPVLAGILNGYPWSQLPANAWTEPVKTDNREWAQISGDWVQPKYDILGTNYNPYTTAPKTPHIIWANQVWSSGLPGGIWGSLAYSSGTAGAGGIVLDGKIYENSAKSGYFDCYDLRTGLLLWEAAGSIQGAQRIFGDYQTASQQNEGFISEWLWGSMTASGTGTGSAFWVRYDPFTGAVIQNITGVPRDLSIIKYDDSSPIIWCAESNLNTWNTTLPAKITYANLIKWDFSKLTTTVGYAQVTSNNWAQGVVWNVSVVQPDQVSVADNNFRGLDLFPYSDANVVVVKTPNAMQIMAGYDYTTGKFLWKNNATVLDIDVQAEGIATTPSGPLIKNDGASPNWVAYNVKTGRELWRSSTGEIPWSLLPAYTFVYHNGTTFMGSYDGHVYAHDINTGSIKWQSDFYGAEDETIYGTQPYNGRSVGADGVLYYSSDTTYRMEPRTRFHAMVAINETTGKYLWTLPIGIAPTAVSDGYLIGTDTDNGVQYGIGKGPTTTSISIQNNVVSAGTAIMITGSVMDMSPGKPNTPAVSDADMPQWMDYLYGQNATLLNNPPSPKGVPITLMAVDPNGNLLGIGTTTSDADGHFAYQWTPQTQGSYTVYASFTGSESYFASHDSTALGVTAAPAPSETSAPVNLDTVNSSMTNLIIGSTIAIIIAIALVGLLLFRRRA
jgi:outer membrane protein assembly factor BamB